MSASRIGDALERRTVELLIELGYRAERVSRRGRFGTSDLFGVADLVSVHPEHGVELHQVTTASGASHRRRKIRDAALGWPVRLWKWAKVGARWSYTSETVEPGE